MPAAAFAFAILLASILPPPSARAAKIASLVATYSDDEDRDSEGDEYGNALPQPDTTITVHPGVALEIENFAGQKETGYELARHGA